MKFHLIYLSLITIILISGCITGRQVSVPGREQDFTGSGLGRILMGGDDLPPEFVYGDPLIIEPSGAPEGMYRNATSMRIENGVMFSEVAENTVYRFRNEEGAEEFLSEIREGKEGETFLLPDAPSDSFGWFSADPGFTGLVFRKSEVAVMLRYRETVDMYSLPVEKDRIIKVAESIFDKF